MTFGVKLYRKPLACLPREVGTSILDESVRNFPDWKLFKTFRWTHISLSLSETRMMNYARSRDRDFFPVFACSQSKDRYQWRLLFRGLLIGTTAVFSVFSGLAPELSHTTIRPLVFSTTAVAEMTDETVRNYARAVLEIEDRRQSAYDEAKTVMHGNVPKEVCRQDNIPRAVQEICNDFLHQSAAIIRKNGLTNAEFNEITRRVQTDTALGARVKQELLRLQAASSSQ